MLQKEGNPMSIVIGFALNKNPPVTHAVGYTHAGP